MQGRPWFNESMWVRLAFGLIFAAGYAILVYDLLSIVERKEAGAREPLAAAGT